MIVLIYTEALQCEAPKIAFSWFITPISLWFMVLIAHNYSIHGVYKPTFTSPGGPTKRSEKDLRTVEKRWIFASFAMAQQHA